MERLFIGIIAIILVVPLMNVLYIMNEKNQVTSAAIIDGQATFGEVGFSITVDGDGPSITIYQPENITYEHNESIPLEATLNDTANISAAYYNVNNGSNVSLTIQNNQITTTIVGLDTESGWGTLTLYANDTLNNLASEDVYISVNHSIGFEINYSSFNNSYSTQLNLLNETELQNISNFTLAIAGFGSILFNTNINLTNDNVMNGPINLDAHVIITANYIFINDSAMPNLNESANLTLTNLTFVNPIILYDGVECPATICEKILYQDGDLLFTVQHFSSYEGSEGGGSSGGSSGGGGNGGGGSSNAVTQIIGMLSSQRMIRLSVGQRAVFTVNIDSQLYNHVLTLLQIDRRNNNAEIRLDSQNNIRDVFDVGMEKVFDVTQDGNPDILIKIVEISLNEVIILLDEVSDKKDVPLPEIQEEKPQGEEQSIQEGKVQEQDSSSLKRKENSRQLVVYMIVMLLLIIVGSLGWRKHKKRRKRLLNRVKDADLRHQSK